MEHALEQRRAAFQIGSVTVPPGTRRTIDIPVSVMSNHTPVTLPVHVIHGRHEGPTLFVSAVVHGDEIIGVEIIRRLLQRKWARLRGTLLAIPVVNAFGFINRSRYLPDRRDLNRSFPGGPAGSLASRLADLFMNEIVMRSNFGIDLHSAGLHRTNLPQIRIADVDAKTRRLAMSFGAPILLTSPLREGSLRQAAHAKGVDVIVYEAGEALRLDELGVRAGVRGVIQVMRELGMTGSQSIIRETKMRTQLSSSSYWVRSPEGGVFRGHRTTGDTVGDDDLLGIVSDPFGEVETEVRAVGGGLIIGRTNLPTVNQGDALFHIARVTSVATTDEMIERMATELGTDPLFDEDEIL